MYTVLANNTGSFQQYVLLALNILYVYTKASNKYEKYVN